MGTLWGPKGEQKYPKIRFLRKELNSKEFRTIFFFFDQIFGFRGHAQPWTFGLKKKKYEPCPDRSSHAKFREKHIKIRENL